MSEEILHLQRIPKIYAYTEAQHAETVWKGARKGKGLLKVGYTERSVEECIAEQFPTNRPSAQPYTILLDEFAIREGGTIRDGDSFLGDHEVHKELENIGAKRFPNSEWFECTVQEVQAAIEAVKTSTHLQPTRLKSFKMRPEQAEAVKMTSAYRAGSYRQWLPYKIYHTHLRKIDNGCLGSSLGSDIHASQYLQPRDLLPIGLSYPDSLDTPKPRRPLAQ